MTLEFKIKPKDLGKFERRYGAFLGVELRAEMRPIGRQIVGALEAASADIADQGKFQKGWRAKWVGKMLVIWNVESHAIYVEKGRGKNKTPPPVRAIRPWVRRHIGKKGAEYAVAKSIGKKGIKARPVMSAIWMQRRMQRLAQQGYEKALDRAARRAAR